MFTAKFFVLHYVCDIPLSPYFDSAEDCWDYIVDNLDSLERILRMLENYIRKHCNYVSDSIGLHIMPYDLKTDMFVFPSNFCKRKS